MNGKLKAYCKIIYANGATYVGSINTAYKKDGQGKITHPLDGSVYEGNFKDDKFHGQGKYSYTDGRYSYEGSFIKNVK